MEASGAVLSKVLISGGGRCNVMHNPLKGAKEIAKVGSPSIPFYLLYS